jgi:hypothetical protein
MVDSALSGKKAELSFSWTVEILEKTGPDTPPMANHAMIVMMAI